MSSLPTPPTETHVIIIGAGVSGLALAQGLSRNSISFTVHERDARLDSRLQGYRLKFMGDTVAKLRSLLTPSAMTRFEETCAEATSGETNLNATDAAVTACRKARISSNSAAKAMGKPYAVDRGLLRKALMLEIGSKVKFGSEFVKYEVIESSLGKDGGATSLGRIKAYFADGSTEEGTLLVGADGFGSVVRRQFLPGWDPIDTGGCCVYGKSPLTTELQARFPPEFRRWITVVRDQPPTIEGIIFGPKPVTMVLEPCHFRRNGSHDDIPEDYVHWGILFRDDYLGMTDEELKEALNKDPSDLAVDITSEWHPSIKSLIELQDTSLAHGTKIYSAKLPIPSWPSTAHVVVLGDAIHVMSPSGGVGAVAALNDSFELVQAIVNEGITVESMRRFEEKMRAYAENCIQRSNFAGAKMLGLSS